MSYEDLEEHNIFLPEEHWNELDLSSSVNQTVLFITIVTGIASCILMVLGAGGTLTWIGAGIFFAFLISFTLISNTGINNQNEKIKNLMREDES